MNDRSGVAQFTFQNRVTLIAFANEHGRASFTFASLNVWFPYTTRTEDSRPMCSCSSPYLFNANIKPSAQQSSQSYTVCISHACGYLVYGRVARFQEMH